MKLTTEQDKVLVPRRSKEERLKQYQRSILKQIHFYVKAGGVGDLDLTGNPITRLPDNLQVGGDLSLTGTLIKSLPNTLKIQGNLHIGSTSVTSLPGGLEVKESIYATYSKLETISKGIKVGENFHAGYTSIKELPEGFEVRGKIDIKNTPIHSLPSTLKCTELDIRSTYITEIPEGVQVKEKLSVSKIPEKYPKHLEDVVAIGGNLTIKQIRDYEKIPKVSITIGRKNIKGRGISIPISKLDNDKVKKFLDKYQTLSSTESLIRRVKAEAAGADKVLDLDFKQIYFFIRKDYGFSIEPVAVGKTQEGETIAVLKNALMSQYGKISTKSFRNWNLTPRQEQNAKAKLFPQKHSPAKKGKNIRTLMTGPDSKEVYWKIGRKTRGGQGVQGQAKDLIPSLSGTSQDNMTITQQRYKVEWGDMMVFDNRGSINIIARAKEPDEEGEYYYFDKYGYGKGGGNRVFKGPDYTVK